MIEEKKQTVFVVFRESKWKNYGKQFVDVYSTNQKANDAANRANKSGGNDFQYAEPWELK